MLICLLIGYMTLRTSSPTKMAYDLKYQPKGNSIQPKIYSQVTKLLSVNSQSHYWREALEKKIRYKRTTLDLFWGLAHMSYFWSLHLPWKILDWALQIILFYLFKFPSSLSIAAPTPLLASGPGLAATFPSFAFSISFSWSQPVTKHFFFYLQVLHFLLNSCYQFFIIVI